MEAMESAPHNQTLISSETMGVLFGMAKNIIWKHRGELLNSLSEVIRSDLVEIALHRIIETYPQEDGEFFFGSMKDPDSDLSYALRQEFRQILELQKDQFPAPLMNIRSSRRRPLENLDLHRKTRYALAILRLKINETEDIECSEEDFYELFGRLADDKNFNQASLAENGERIKSIWRTLPPNQKKMFQAGVTNFSETDDWSSQIPRNAHIVLTTLAELCPEDLDLRISRQMDETIWYMEKMGLSPAARDTVIHTLLNIEPLYRGKERKYQRNKNNPFKKETAFNHFLGVLRTSLGLIDLARKNQDQLSPSAAKFFDSFTEKSALLELCLTAATHDVVEDNAIDPRGLRTILKRCVAMNSSGFNDLEESDLVQNCLLNSAQLDTHNFVDDKGKRHYPTYTRLLLDSKNPVLILVKIADILVNKRSPLGESHETPHVSLKDDAYIDFIYTATVEMKLVPVLPARFIADMAMHYPAWIEDKRIQQCLQVWLPNLDKVQKFEFIQALHAKGIAKRVEKVISRSNISF